MSTGRPTHSSLDSVLFDYCRRRQVHTTLRRALRMESKKVIEIRAENDLGDDAPEPPKDFEQAPQAASSDDR